MAEQNANDDERDTADLAAGDTSDSAVDDAMSLATGDEADLAADDTSDLAVHDAADLAAGGTADLAAGDAARSQAPAEQLTPAGRAVSPSPSLRPRSPLPTAPRAARAGCGGSPESAVP